MNETNLMKKSSTVFMKGSLICCLLLRCASGLADVAHTNHYVWAGSPTPGEPYHAWTNAAHDIQAAVNYASVGDTVWVTNGVYINTTNRINIDKNITLKSVNGAEFTVIDGNFPSLTNQCLKVFGSGATKSITDGFTFTNAGLAGVWMTRSSLLNSIITGNGVSLPQYGGGIYMGNRDSGQPGGIVSNCVIYGNTGSNGGGVYMFSNADLYGPCHLCFSQIVGNTAISGGGINTYLPKNGSCLIESCQITNNAAQSAGGLYCTANTTEKSVSATIRNCLVASNSANIGTAGHLGYGGGIAIVNHPDCKVENSTVVMNTARKFGGGLYYSGLSRTGTVENTIIDLNIAPVNPGVNAVDGLLAFTNCSLQSLADITSNTSIETNAQCLFEVDTRFVDSTAGNYRLRPSSPCVNAGINQSWMFDALDRDYQPRIQNDTVDMGAYETYLQVGTWILVR